MFFFFYCLFGKAVKYAECYFPSGPDGHLARSYAISRLGSLQRVTVSVFWPPMSGRSLFADHRPQVRVILGLGLGLGLGLRLGLRHIHSPQVSGHWSCNSDTLPMPVCCRRTIAVFCRICTSASDGQYH